MQQNIIDIGPLNLAFSLTIILMVYAIIQFNRIQARKDLLISILRMSVQLTFAGFALLYLFNWDVWYISPLLYLVMVYFASHSVITRAKVKVKFLFFWTWLALGLSSLLICGIVLFLVIPLPVWYDPRYFIPIVGMLLGNSLNACAICIERFYSGIKDQIRMIESNLLLGATIKEATHELFVKAFKAALMPTLASMTAMGIVWLPGMMTGVILSGVDPTIAIKYQIMIMIGILGVVALSLHILLHGMTKILFKPNHQLLDSY